ncbi:hypothetical protein EWM64_g6885 [Hericium alpestre]|uniref:Peptidase S53 domain-containing protein n=1 Tax=Hericium alpestre TaxID=135208 RepID=A0A4Y9ZSU5_9AGAM|nr:hypothetical protein EWM64_g6885 [Hericium alpestre]
MLKLSVLLASLASLSCASPHPGGNMHVHERRDSPPTGFAHVSPASADLVLDLRLALVPNNMDGLHRKVYDVSTPGNAAYGQHLSKEEVEALVAPSSESDAAVKDWLSSNNIAYQTTSPAGDWLNVKMTVRQANTLLGSQFTTYKHLETDRETVRTLSYSIPASLKGHLDFVHPTVAFVFFLVLAAFVLSYVEVRSGNVTAGAAPASCNDEFLPSCAQGLYGIPATAATQKSNQLAVSGFIGEYASQADLELLLENFRPDLAGSTFSTSLLDDGQNDQSNPGIEANLDTQYTVAIASRVPVQFISVGENNSDDVDGFLDIVNFLLGEKPIPQTFTTSYGFNEPDLPFSIANNLCNAYAQLGARGTSVLFSSGDGGVSGSQSQSCTAFIPTFPSGCPFVTSVGATQNVNPEIAAYFSSGGFSNYFARPAYQNAAVSSYLAKIGAEYQGKFNATGRGFPDLSAAGVNFLIAVGGQGGLVDGTSASTPLTASIISLLNDQLIARGRSSLGFLNPLIYSNPHAFTPITSGTNPGCNTQGFSASAGWSPVTGVGSPIFSALKRVAGL